LETSPSDVLNVVVGSIRNSCATHTTLAMFHLSASSRIRSRFDLRGGERGGEGGWLSVRQNCSYRDLRERATKLQLP